MNSLSAAASKLGLTGLLLDELLPPPLSLKDADTVNDGYDDAGVCAECSLTVADTPPSSKTSSDISDLSNVDLVEERKITSKDESYRALAIQMLT